MRIDFYHLTLSPLDKVLPPLLEKIYSTGQRAVLRTELSERVAYFNTFLWTYQPNAFLPHGTKDRNAAQHPIYITHKANDNPNSATNLVLIDDSSLTQDEDFARVFYLFNGQDENSLAKARALWQSLKETAERHYWQQTAAGGWTENQSSI